MTMTTMPMQIKKMIAVLSAKLRKKSCIFFGRKVHSSATVGNTKTRISSMPRSESKVMSTAVMRLARFYHARI